jgi:hypothetical protein
MMDIEVGENNNDGEFVSAELFVGIVSQSFEATKSSATTPALGLHPS